MFVWFNSNTTPVTSRTRTDNPSRIHPCVSLFFVCFFSIFYIYVVFCSAFLVPFCYRLHCLFFFGIFRLFLRKSTWVHRGFWWVRVAHLFSFVCSGFRVVMIRYYFHMYRIFGSSLPPIVWRRVLVLFKFFVFVDVKWCPTHIVLYFVLFFLVLFTLCCQFI